MDDRGVARANSEIPMSRKKSLKCILHSIDLAMEFFWKSKEAKNRYAADFWLGVADRYTKELLELEI